MCTPNETEKGKLHECCCVNNTSMACHHLQQHNVKISNRTHRINRTHFIKTSKFNKFQILQKTLFITYDLAMANSDVA